MTLPLTPQARLADLLALLFAPERDPQPLRTWFGRWPDTVGVLPILPGPSTAAANLCEAVVSALVSHGRVDQVLFARLLGSFPSQVVPIGEVATVFGFVLGAAAPPPASLNESHASVPSRPPLMAVDLSRLKPIAATVPAIEKLLQSRPLLWVGAGTSVAAGLPSSGALVDAMIADCVAEDPDAEGWRSLSLFDVSDRYIEAQSQGRLGELLQTKIGRAHPTLTPVLRVIARLARQGRFAAIVTTNYDDMIERALREADTPYFTRGPDANEAMRGTGEVELIKLHGSMEAWNRVVLSGRAYQDFAGRYPYWTSELDVLLRKHPVLFVGCSLQDPRILSWLADMPDSWLGSLQPWRALLTRKAWDEVLRSRFPGGEASGALARSALKPFILEDHDHLNRLFGDLPLPREPGEPLALTIQVGAHGWQVSAPGMGTWSATDPAAEPAFCEDLRRLRVLDFRALPTDASGALTDDSARVAAAIRTLAADIGGRLTAAVLPAPQRAALALTLAANPLGSPLPLTLRVAAESDRHIAADRVLALPWELLVLDGRFPVEDGRLDLVREAMVPDLPGLTAPTQPLEVVVTIAAPVDAPALDYEGESYRLWLAMGAEEARLHFTHTGTLQETVQAIRRHKPAVFHFTGHGEPGALLFETETALKNPVTVAQLVRQLATTQQLPRLAFLASCYSASTERHVDPAVDLRLADTALLGDAAPSTAAALHRAGFAQVLAYFGPVGDVQSTRTEAAIYRRLAEGQTARLAVREARVLASQPHLDVEDHAQYVYPLGWAQLALYLRGTDLPTATPGRAGGAEVLVDRHDRVLERLDPLAGQTAPTIGVQRLRHGFVGQRRARAELLRRWSQGQRLLVVTGLGGLGKTALCTEFLGRLGEEAGTRLLALDGRSAGRATDALAHLWQQLAAADHDEAWDTALAAIQKHHGLGGTALTAAVAALAGRVHHLAVYLDDAESLQVPLSGGELGQWQGPEVSGFWRGLCALARPAGSVTVLASARYTPDDLPTEGHLALPEMARIDLVRLLRWFPTLGRLPVPDIAWLAPRLDGHPRTVEWLDALAGEQVLALRPPSGPWAPSSWQTEILIPVLPIAYNQIRGDLLLPQVIAAAGPAARDHLGRCSLLQAPAPWSVVLAVEPTPGTGRRLGALGLLGPYQAPTGEEPYWAPHRMVADAVAAMWTEDPLPAHEVLGACFAAAFEGDRRPDLAEGAVFHLLAANQADGAWRVAKHVVLALRRSGRYREALAQVERVLAGGPTGVTLGMGLTYRLQLELLSNVQGQDAGDARAWFERRTHNLTRAEHLVASNEQGFVLHELARLLRHSGDLPGAAQALERALSIEVTVLGTEENPDVAASLASLAVILQAQGDLEGAKKHLLRALSIHAKVFGTEEHPDVAESLQTLGSILLAQGDLEGAKKTLLRTLSIFAKVFGTEEHPAVAKSLHEMAAVLQSQGDLEGAKKLLRRALTIYAKVLGTKEHPEFAESLHEMARILLAQGDPGGAKKHLLCALAILDRSFGTEDHPGVAISLHELARVLRAQGDLEGAKKHILRALSIYAKVFGTEKHPDVAASIHELAGILQVQDDLEGAVVQFRRVLDIERHVYGTRDHYSTCITELELASILLVQGDRQGATELLQHALVVFKRKLPPGHLLIQQTQQLLVFAGA